MTTLISAINLRQIDFGTYLKKTYALADNNTTHLYTVVGLVCVTVLVGVVTTSITVANTVKLMVTPTIGSAQDLCLATDLGTVDTVAGNLLGITGEPEFQMITYSGVIQRFPGYEGGATHGLYVNAGTIDIVTTGTGLDGAIDWHLCYAPVTAAGGVS